jgi:O-antigen/teichoic acid export membrane protein
LQILTKLESKARVELGEAFRSSLARNAGWMFLGQGFSVVCQAAYFVCLGRLLGATEYGIYAGAVALVSLLAQYSALGSHSVFLRYVSPEPGNFRRYWANIVVTTTVLGSVFTAVLAWVGPHVSHSSMRGLLACVAVGDCVCAQLTLGAGRVFQAFDRMRVTAMLNLLTNLLRAMLAAVLLWTVHRATARGWVWATLAVSALVSATAVTLVTKYFGKPEFSGRLLKARAGEGLVFALSYSTTGLYNDMDKAMLGHYGMNLANGIYTMAYRVVDVGMMPISAVHTTAFPRFFKKGAEGAVSTYKFAQRILKRTAPVGLALAVAMWVAAGVIPHIVGGSFAESTTALRWLCLLPLFRSFHMSAGDALSGAGHQKLRLATQTVAAVFNFGTNLYLIPQFGWYGAAWSSLATDGMLGIMNWCVLIRVSRASSKFRRLEGLPVRREPQLATRED